MKRRAFLRRMAFAAMAGMLGSRLEWAQSQYGGTAAPGKDAFVAYMTDYMQLLTERYKIEQHRIIFEKGPNMDLRDA